MLHAKTHFAKMVCVGLPDLEFWNFLPTFELEQLKSVVIEYDKSIFADEKLSSKITHSRTRKIIIIPSLQGTSCVGFELYII